LQVVDGFILCGIGVSDSESDVKFSKGATVVGSLVVIDSEVEVVSDELKDFCFVHYIPLADFTSLTKPSKATHLKSHSVKVFLLPLYQTRMPDWYLGGLSRHHSISFLVISLFFMVF
jgi:hypothetical protein